MSVADLLANPQLVRPSYIWVPDYTFSAGPEVADVAELAGIPPDLQQQLILDVLFAERAGRPVAFEVDVIAPRRNLKTSTAQMACLGWLYLMKIERVLYTAHDWNPACKDMFRDMKRLIDSNAWLSRRVRRIYEGNGEESIDFKSGQQMLFKTRTNAGGLGSGNDKLITDEGLELQQSHEDALLPTLATKEQRQNLLLSSAGKRHSARLRDRRDRGRPGALDPAAGDPTLAWIEWCMPDPAEACERGEQCDHGKRTPGCGLDNPTMLRRSNPTLSTPRLTLDSLKEQRAALSPAGFGREFGGWFDTGPAEAGDDAPIDPDVWSAREDANPDHAPEHMKSYAVELDKDGAFAAIGSAGRRDDAKMHVEHVLQQRGTRGLVERCVALNDEHGPAVFVIDGGGPAARLIPDLEAAGLYVVRMGVADVVEAAGELVDMVDEDMVVHGPQFELERAVEVVRKRTISERGFAFTRTAESLPILCAAFAAWGWDHIGNQLSVFFFSDLDDDETPPPPAPGDDDEWV